MKKYAVAIEDLFWIEASSEEEAEEKLIEEIGAGNDDFMPHDARVVEEHELFYPVVREDDGAIVDYSTDKDEAGSKASRLSFSTAEEHYVGQPEEEEPTIDLQ